LDRDLI